MSDGMLMIAFGYLSLVACATGLWLLSLRLGDVSIVDRCWGLLFVVETAVYAFLSQELSPRQYLVMTLVLIWGVRLSVHIHARNRGHGEDYRYQQMRRHHGEQRFWWYSYFSVFLLQATLAFIISAPIVLCFVIPGNQSLGLLDMIGIGLWGIGFFFESVADYQLRRFKLIQGNEGKLLTTGLWGLTRHPNYFGDATLWWGYYLIACAVPFGFLSFAGPALMSFLIVRVSGVRLLEQDLIRKKPGYEDYIRSTPAFFPSPRLIVRSLLRVLRDQP